MAAVGRHKLVAKAGPEPNGVSVNIATLAGTDNGQLEQVPLADHHQAHMPLLCDGLGASPGQYENSDKDSTQTQVPAQPILGTGSDGL